MARHRMVALVGAGGKTSTLYALARQAADSGRTVVVTTTTHILRHPGLPLVEEPTPERLRAALEGHGVVTVGTVFRGDKLSGAGTPEELRRAADVVLVEADGAKRLPLKAPAEYEPVIPPCADAVAAVAGMDAVGQAVGAVCHRPERVCALLGAGAEHVLTPEDVALLLANPQGGRKGVGEAMAFRCVLNKADTPEPVSYTHLDVYKRQGAGCRGHPGGCGHLCGEGLPARRRFDPRYGSPGGVPGAHQSHERGGRRGVLLSPQLQPPHPVGAALVAARREGGGKKAKRKAEAGASAG